ncbi:MAG: hypothetical protein HXY25_09050, partial [Alphaproteobacteria bacterium]|nr:hypothetical protein [Alphaproteobacteria bacterium]
MDLSGRFGGAAGGGGRQGFWRRRVFVIWTGLAVLAAVLVLAGLLAAAYAETRPGRVAVVLYGTNILLAYLGIGWLAAFVFGPRVRRFTRRLRQARR